MKVKEEKLQELEKLGFSHSRWETYYEKPIGYTKYIRVYDSTNEIKFYIENAYGDEIECLDSVPQFAFITLYQMAQMDLLED